MRKLITIVAVASAIITGIAIASEARAGGDRSQHDYCHYLKQKAMWTGDDFWWSEWRRCIRGDW